MTYSPAVLRDTSAECQFPLGVIFDLDGTLVDNESLHMSLIQETARVVGYRLTAEEYLTNLMGLTDEDIFTYILKNSCRTLAVKELVSIKQTKYLEHLTAGDIQPTLGAVSFANGLQERGIRIAVATNASRIEAALTLRSIGLSTLINTTVTVEAVSMGKPAPDIYLRAARLMGIEPRDCVAYEDSVHGIQAATAAGIYVIGIDRSGQQRLRAAGAAMVIDDFMYHELPVNLDIADEMECA